MAILEHSDSIFIDRTPDDLYDLVSDITRMGAWSPVCKECWWDEGAGPEVGAWFTGRNELPDRTWETRSEIVAADRGREFAFVVNGSWTRWGYRFTPLAGGTRLTESWEFLPGGAKMFEERFGADAEAQIANRLELAQKGIPATLAAIKRDAEGSREFFDVVLHQRACREFSPEPVDEALIERCLEAATHAPSAENLQPWRFVVVQEPELLAKVGELTRRAWTTGGRAHSEGRLSEAMLADVDRGATGGTQAAPVTIVVCGQTGPALEVTLPASVFPATQNLLLAATALGLGSAMTTLATLFADELAALLGLPESVRPMAVVPIGWPRRPLGPPRRLPVSERATRDGYARPW